MFKQLQIQNFKGWQDTGVIRMAPITLFFGANSSGKSSIGQFLMMLKQTIELQDRKAVFYPGGRNSPVQLGSYKEMVFNRDPTRKIKFSYSWSLPDELSVKDHISEDTFEGDHFSFQAEIGSKDHEEHNLFVEYLKYELMNDTGSSLGISMNKKKTRSEYEVKSDKYDLVKQQGRPWLLRQTVRFYGFPEEVLSYYQNADFLQELNLRHEKLFQSIHYLGPLRTKPERFYSWAGIQPESVGFAGENTIAAILAADKRKIAFKEKDAKRSSKRRILKEVIASRLQSMGLIEEFTVKPISKGRQEYEVKIRTKGSNNPVDLPDVGFGISQVLPVLVQCFYAPPESIILMEQPEIHLHPSAQAALADIVIDVIKSREGRKDRNIQLIIETHSEHFLRRLQRRIAEDQISKDNVAAYFANAAKVPSVLEPLDIDIYGNIKNWPENFFGDEMGDMIHQADAAAQKNLQ